MSECLFVSSLLGQSTGIYVGVQVSYAQLSCFTAAAMAASPSAVGVGEILYQQNPFVDRRANCRSRAASHKSSSVSSSHGCPPLITTPAMEASLEAGAFGEISRWRSNSAIHGYSPIALSQGWGPISTTHGQCCHDGGLARRERNATMFVGGVRRRGARQDSFLNRTRSKDIIRASAEEKKKAGGISFGDQLLDYIEGGPKLRKWYGAPDQLPKDSGNKEQKPEVPESVVADDADNQDLVRDVVLVTDAESATGQLVVLELILRRLRVRALVKDIKAATVGFGAYVEPVEGDVNDTVILKKVMRGVRAIICPTKVGKLANRELVKGVEHIVLLSKLAVSKNQGGLGALFGGLSKRDAEANEAAIASLGIPYTIVRAGSLKDEEGGKLGFRYGQDGNVQGSISREDAAYVCVEALDSPPQSARVFEVANGREEVEDWSVVLTSMQETTTASGS